MSRPSITICLGGLAVLAAAATATAQAPVVMPGTETHAVTAAANGVEYQIDVALPAGYPTSAKRYPVFYILDGNLAFAHLVSTYRELRINAAFPELIIVGIGWPGDDPSIYTPAYHANRSRDYTPTNVEAALPGSGKAGAFLGFVTNELVPMIDARYRTDPNDRALGGHSLGGLFTTFALLSEPGMFRRYWIGSPSLWWDKERIFALLPEARARAAHPTGRALLTVGGLEAELMVPPMKRMAAALKASFPRLETESVVYPDEEHLSVLGGAMSRALRVLYARPEILIGPADAAAYAGLWRSASGETIEIAHRGRKVLMTMTIYGSRSTSELSAETRDHLFSKTMAVDIIMERQGGAVVRLRRNAVGTEMVFERVR